MAVYYLNSPPPIWPRILWYSLIALAVFPGSWGIELAVSEEDSWEWQCACTALIAGAILLLGVGIRGIKHLPGKRPLVGLAVFPASLLLIWLVDLFLPIHCFTFWLVALLLGVPALLAWPIVWCWQLWKQGQRDC